MERRLRSGGGREDEGGAGWGRRGLGEGGIGKGREGLRQRRNPESYLPPLVARLLSAERGRQREAFAAGVPGGGRFSATCTRLQPPASLFGWQSGPFCVRTCAVLGVCVCAYRFAWYGR
jgi:hypothetical protein